MGGLSAIEARARDPRARAQGDAARSPSEFRRVLHRHENVPGVAARDRAPVWIQVRTRRRFDRAPAPELGQHTDEVLASVGYSAAQIAEMRKSGAVA